MSNDKQILDVQAQIRKALERGASLDDEEVVALSQRLDELIISYYESFPPERRKAQ